MLLLGGQGWSQSIIPPGRAVFDLSAPVPVALGKLWTDVGLFYPFPGPTRRVDWERDYFALLNRSLKDSESLDSLAAQALGLLGDPNALVLPKSEGKGEYFIPLLFEFDREGRAWIVGGDRAIVAKRLGPVTHINGETIQSFLARRVGDHPSPDQATAALSMAGHQASRFEWAISFSDGTNLKVPATKVLPGDVWIEGGWDGVSLHELPGLSSEGLAAVRRLDLRMAPWMNAGASTLLPKLTPVWRSLKARALAQETYVATRQNTGYPDGSISGVYTSKVTLEPVPFLQQPAADSAITVRWPQGGYVPSGLSRALGGWALSPDAKALASRTRYALGAVDVIFPTSMYVSRVSFQGSASTGPSRGELPALGFEHGKLLQREAAKALAVATIMNFDQLFGFTPERVQRSFAEGLLGLLKDAADVPDLILRSAPLNQEPHAHVRQANGGARTDSDEKVRHLRTPPRRFLPFRILSPDPRTLVVLVATPPAGAASPMRAGAKILGIEGIPVQEWLVRAARINPGRSDDRMRVGIELNYCLPDQESLSVEFANPGEAAQVRTIALLSGKEFTEVHLPALHPTLPAGWTLVNTPEQLSTDEMIRRSEAGENFLVDFRVPDVLADPDTRLAIPDLSYFIKSPSQPAPWGSSPGSISMQAVRAKVGKPEMPPPALKGRIVLLVWGENQSSTESQPIVLKAAQGMSSHVYLVGLPTAGITGPTTTIRLPLGEETGFAYYTPTGAWPVFRSRSIQYQGLPLDWGISIERLLEQSKKKGSQDPLLECTIEDLNRLPATAKPW